MFQTTAKQIGNKMLVTNFDKPTSVSKGDKIIFNYFGQVLTGTVVNERFSTTYNDQMIYVDNPNCGELELEGDQVHKIYTCLVDLPSWVIGQMFEAGIITIQEAVDEITLLKYGDEVY